MYFGIWGTSEDKGIRLEWQLCLWSIWWGFTYAAYNHPSLQVESWWVKEVAETAIPFFSWTAPEIIYEWNDETSSNIRQVVICAPAIKF